MLSKQNTGKLYSMVTDFNYFCLVLKLRKSQIARYLPNAHYLLRKNQNCFWF